MATRRGASGLAGLLVIDKPAGMTSHDVVNVVRRATGERRVGHAGTLDPAATGVLMVLVGPYTRLERYLSAEQKTYEAVIAFGSETDTDDAEGTPVRSASVDPAFFTPERARDVLDTFRGPQEQMPPAYSAIKVGGRTAHRVARSGGTVELAPRTITVHEAVLLGSDPGSRTWTVRFTVSKGTYIRSLARDIGVACGSAAHLLALRRTASGDVDLSRATTLDTVRDAASPSDVSALFTDILIALGLPALELDPGEAALVRDGRPLEREGVADGELVALTAHGALVGIYCARHGRLVAETVLGAGT